ncbi:MAG: alpha/beta hydrolase, partial [Firmicutes bacterium]|nr:alpha/beta hydrolase [Bacillota bacterium]
MNLSQTAKETSAKHPKIWRFLCILAALTVFFSLLSLYSHIKYHRSSAATVAEADLRILLLGQDESELTQKLAKLIEEGEKVHEIPDIIRFKSAQSRIDYRYGSNTLPVVVLEPDEPSDLIIYYLHGGSYLDEPNPFHWRMLDELSQSLSATVYTPDYPMIPFHDADFSYPLVLAHYCSVVQQNPDKQIVLMGDSAGGGYALGLTAYLQSLATIPMDGLSLELQTPRKRLAYLPDYLVLLSPWVDVSMENPDIDAYLDIDPMLKKDQLMLCGQLWAGGRDVKDPLISPLYAYQPYRSTGEFTGTIRRSLVKSFPKTLIFAGTREMFYPDINLFYETLQDIGCDVTLSVGEGMNHV